MLTIYNFFDLILIMLLLYISFFDIKNKIIRNKDILILVLLALILRTYDCTVLFSFSPLTDALLGMLIAGMPAVIIILISKGGVGGGDMKLYAALGLYFGIKDIICIFMLSIIIAGIAALLLIILKFKSMKSKIAMAPYITAGAIIMILFRQQIYLIMHNFYGI